MSMNNTNQHISNESVYVKFDPTGTAFGPTTVNVQDALAQLSPDGVSGVPQATETVVGKARLATQTEVDQGISGDTIVTPATLNVRLQRPQATKDVFGVTRYATNQEALTGTAKDRSIVASSLKYVLDDTFEHRVATELKNGVLKLATTPAATAGVDDTTAMTPLKTKQAIAAATSLIPAYGPATEATQGVVRMTTLAQLRNPALREGFAPSPFTLNQWQATEDNMGAGKVATQPIMNTGTSDTALVTPLKFKNTRASVSQVGTTMLADAIGDATKALAGNAKVLASDRNTVTTAGVYQGAITWDNKYQTYNEVERRLPIGAMYMTAYNADRGDTLICNGRWLNKNDYPALFSRIGFTYGGDGGNMFALPDMRGVFARGCDHGRNLDPGRGFGSYQEDTMQRMTGQFGVADRWRAAVNGVFRSFGRWSTNYKNGNGDEWGNHIVMENWLQVRTSDENRPKSLAVNYVIVVK